MTQSSKFHARYSLYDRIGIRIEGDDFEWAELQVAADTTQKQEPSEPRIGLLLTAICFGLTVFIAKILWRLI